jgi:hypothetical protein
MERGAADYGIGEGVREGHRFDRFRAKVVRRQRWREGCRQMARGIDGSRVCVNSIHVEAFPEQINEITARAAAHIDDTHARSDAAAQQLIEQINIYVTKLPVKIAHSVNPIPACGP